MEYPSAKHNHKVGRAASVVSPFYFIFLAEYPNLQLIDIIIKICIAYIHQVQDKAKSKFMS